MASTTCSAMSPPRRSAGGRRTPGRGSDGLRVRGALIRDAYLAACRTELRALKPGNVHDYAPGHGMNVADFEASAIASAPSLAAPGIGVGARILDAVER